MKATGFFYDPLFHCFELGGGGDLGPFFAGEDTFRQYMCSDAVYTRFFTLDEVLLSKCQHLFTGDAAPAASHPFERVKVIVTKIHSTPEEHGQELLHGQVVRNF